MTKQELEATWGPRIGQEALLELRRYRKIGGIGMAMPVFAVAAGLLIGTSTLGDLVGGVLAAVYVSFIRAQRRLAVALSRWFGVEIKGIPKMKLKRFDAWCQERGLRKRDEQLASSQVEQSPDTALIYLRARVYDPAIGQGINALGKQFGLPGEVIAHLDRR